MTNRASDETSVGDLTETLDRDAGKREPGLQYVAVDRDQVVFEYAGGLADVGKARRMTADAEAIATINRLLQHLTTWRQNHDDHPGWSPSMLADIYTSMDEFIDALPNQEHSTLLGTTHETAADLLRPTGLV